MPRDYPTPETVDDGRVVVAMDPADAAYVVHLLDDAGGPPTAEVLAIARDLVARSIRFSTAELCDTCASDPDEAETPTKFALYRLLDASGRVLYIGISRNLPARLRAHARNWGRLFDDVLVEWYPDEATMLEAEALAIHDEQPPLNSDGIG